jgi:hypothetical protein
MKKIALILRDRKGNMMIYAAVIVLALLIIFAGLFEFVRIYTIADSVRSAVQLDLESTAVQAAKDSFQSVKQYSLSNPVVTQSVLENSICSDLGLTNQGGSFKSVSGTGAKYILESPQFSFSGGSALVLTYKFTLLVPVYFLGVQIQTADIPMTINAGYQFK